MSDQRTIRVAIIGNPNCGKTCLFNNLTGARQHVGNWPGVTVEQKTGSYVYRAQPYEVIDLPGTYSLIPYSIEEEVVETFLRREAPDVLVNILDATNLERHLLLTAQLIGLGIPMVLALNMMDEAEHHGVRIDIASLSRMLGVPVVATVARRNKGTNALLQAIAAQAQAVAPAAGTATVDFGAGVEEALKELCAQLPGIPGAAPPRQRALTLLRGRPLRTEDHALAERARALRAQLERRLHDTLENYLLGRCYGFAHGLARMCLSLSPQTRFDLTEKLDDYLTHPVLGLVLFGVCMWLTFELVFVAGAPLTHLLEIGVEALRTAVMSFMPDNALRSLLADGIVMGVGGVIMFLPNILLLFLAIGVLEDSGYMARAAFVMDGIMHRLGLHGKSFIPMLVGFGCTVPAVLATRALDTRRDRVITALITPFMSCGARLPVYALFISAFFAPAWHATILMSLYVLGIVVAISAANILGLVFFRKDFSPLLMELPPYRLPTLRSVLLLMWRRAWMYLRKAGTLLLGASVAMWFLCSYPRVEQTPRPDGAATPASSAFEQSYAARLGRLAEPLVRPLGFDWKVAVGLISGLAAKEAVVSTLMVVYGVEDSAHGSDALQDELRADPVFAGQPLAAYTLLVFILLYVPCAAVIVIFLREFGVWWTVFMSTYTTLTAWCVAWLVRVAGRLLGWGG